MLFTRKIKLRPCCDNSNREIFLYLNAFSIKFKVQSSKFNRRRLRTVFVVEMSIKLRSLSHPTIAKSSIWCKVSHLTIAKRPERGQVSDRRMIIEATVRDFGEIWFDISSISHVFEEIWFDISSISHVFEEIWFDILSISCVFIEISFVIWLKSRVFDEIPFGIWLKSYVFDEIPFGIWLKPCVFDEIPFGIWLKSRFWGRRMMLMWAGKG